MQTATRRRAPRSAYALMAAVGLAATAILSWLTVHFADGAFTDDGDELLALTLGAVVYAPLAFVVAWVAFVAKHTQKPEPHGEESIEARWVERATSRAFLDLLTVLGLALAVLAIGQISLDAMAMLLALVPAAMGDVAVRYLLLRRRES